MVEQAKDDDTEDAERGRYEERGHDCSEAASHRE
jgi:hypothetical protein